jgi:hypothetical protein
MPPLVNDDLPLSEHWSSESTPANPLIGLCKRCALSRP